MVDWALERGSIVSKNVLLTVEIAMLAYAILLLAPTVLVGGGRFDAL